MAFLSFLTFEFEHLKQSYYYFEFAVMKLCDFSLFFVFKGFFFTITTKLSRNSI